MGKELLLAGRSSTEPPPDLANHVRAQNTMDRWGKNKPPNTHNHFVNTFVFLTSNTMLSARSQRSETMTSAEPRGRMCRIR